MKYRSDFVTNSSSSSFIIAYNNPEDMVKDMLQFVKNYEDDDWSHQYKDVLYDVFKNEITYNEALEKVKEYLKNEAIYKFSTSEFLKKYGNVKEWRTSEEYKNISENWINQELEKFKKTVNPKGYFALLYYSDSDGYYDVEANLQNMINGVYIKKSMH